MGGSRQLKIEAVGPSLPEGPFRKLPSALHRPAKTLGENAKSDVSQLLHFVIIGLKVARFYHGRRINSGSPPHRDGGGPCGAVPASDQGRSAHRKRTHSERGPVQREVVGRLSASPPRLRLAPDAAPYGPRWAGTQRPNLRRARRRRGAAHSNPPSGRERRWSPLLGSYSDLWPSSAGYSTTATQRRPKSSASA
jgi:hypothetical protein